MRLNGLPHIRPPTPPPEIHLGKWRDSIARLRAADFKIIAPTHFGLYDKTKHLNTLAQNIDTIENWTAREMAHAPTPEQFRQRFRLLLDDLARANGCDPADVAGYGDAAGADMSADGVYRYWKKFRAEG